MLLLDTTFPGSEDVGSCTPCICLKETLRGGRGGPELPTSPPMEHWGLPENRVFVPFPGSPFPWITQKTYSHSILISPVSRSRQYSQRSLPVASDEHQGYLRTFLLPIEGLGYRAGAQEWACSHGDFMPTVPAQDLPLPEWVLSGEGKWLSHLQVICQHKAPLISHNQISLTAFSYSRAVDNHQY